MRRARRWPVRGVARVRLCPRCLRQGHQAVPVVQQSRIVQERDAGCDRCFAYMAIGIGRVVKRCGEEQWSYRADAYGRRVVVGSRAGGLCSPPRW